MFFLIFLCFSFYFLCLHLFICVILLFCLPEPLAFALKMINGLYFYSAFSGLTSAFTTQISIHSFIHTFTYKQQGDFSTKSQPAHQDLKHTHSHTSGAAIRSSLGFSFLPEDTSKCRPDEPGIEPPTFWLVDSTCWGTAIPLSVKTQSKPCF